MKAFVLDTDKTPLSPCDAARARKLLDKGKAAIYRRYPFTIILKRKVDRPKPKPLRFKLDPGSKISGMAIIDDSTGDVVWCAELEHRGQQIKNDLESRRSLRRGRRGRKTRYRPPRFLNRYTPKGWLPPSLMSRVYNIETMLSRLRSICNIVTISVENVRFDMQKMENPEISGVEYQQGELHGYEVREYLLEKFNRTCVYCGVRDVPMEVEHIIPKTRGGSNRVSNLTLSCQPCNQKKSDQTAAEFGYPEVEKQAKAPLKDAAAVNATRWEIWRRLEATGLPVEVGTGGRTKYNRSVRNLPKMHWLDAVCVGKSTPETLKINGMQPLQIKATGRGKRQICSNDKHGFRQKKKDGTFTNPKTGKRVYGFQTGDMVKAVVPQGKFRGTYIGRLYRVRANGRFTVQTKSGLVGKSYNYCQIIQRADGYNYTIGDPFDLDAQVRN